MTKSRKPYPSDVSDNGWALVAPYLTLLPEESRQRVPALREVFNGLRYTVKTGAPWRWMPNDLPLWEIVYQQSRRWLGAGCFEALAEDLRVILRLAADEPSNRPPPSSTAGPCDRRRRAALARLMTEPNARKARSRIQPSIRSGIFWLSTSPCQRRRSRRSRQDRQGHSSRDRGKPRNRLRRSGLHRREARSSGGRTRDRSRGHQAARGQARL